MVDLRIPFQDIYDNVGVVVSCILYYRDACNAFSGLGYGKFNESKLAHGLVCIALVLSTLTIIFGLHNLHD